MALPNHVTLHLGVIKKKCKVYVGSHPIWREQMIQTFHDSSIGGHSRILGTYQIKGLKKCLPSQGSRQMF
jgi:hypothetical protein